MPDPATHDRYIEHEIQVLAQFVSLARTREVAPLALTEDRSKDSAITRHPERSACSILQRII